MSNKFQQQMEIGKIGEQAIAKHYRQQGCIVVDVSADRGYQEIDIDMLINGQTVEIKTDYNIHRYGNICVELVSNDSEDRYKAGWFFTSEAKVFIFYSPQQNKSYQVLRKDLQSLYEEHKECFTEKHTITREFDNIYKKSIIAIIPAETVKKYCRSYREVDINV